MSGSYDRPTGPPYPLPPPASPSRTRGPASEPASAPASGPPRPYHTGPQSQPPAPPQPPPHPAAPSHASPYTYESFPASPQGPGPAPAHDHELRVDSAQDGAPAKDPGHAPVVPAGSVTGRSLTLVISIMCFLACLTAGSVYIVNQAASAWLRDIASEITVQVQPREGVDLDKTMRDVAAFLGRQQGIASVKPMSLEDSAALIEPWLGKSDSLKSLPVPRMIAIVIDRSAPPDLEPLRQRLVTQFNDGVVLDDHRVWQQQIRTVTRSLALGGLAILLLVGAATTAIIISATRSAMASNREIVEVLHFVGATDRFIAREFEKHFLRLGIRAGVVGAISAMLVFLLLPMLTEMLGGQSVSMSDLRWIVGGGTLDAIGYAVLLVVVVVIACLCMLTSRFGVYRILHGQH